MKSEATHVLDPVNRLVELHKVFAEFDAKAREMIDEISKIEATGAMTSEQELEFLERLIVNRQQRQQHADELSQDDYTLAEQQLLAEYGYPAALIKACMETFQYRLRLRTGEELDFESATPISREWVSIRSWDHDFPYERGMNIRVAAIDWVVDAPCGS